MTNHIVVLTTVASLREAKKIGRHLIESRLAACVNVSPSLRSIYRWKGGICEDRECLLLIKTRRGLFPEVRDAIAKMHSYRLPEIIGLPIASGSAPYLQWIDEAVRSARKVDAGRSAASRKRPQSASHGKRASRLSR